MRNIINQSGKDNNIFQNSLPCFTVALITLVMAVSMVSCNGSSSFDSITMCESVDEQTLEPQKINNLFEFNADRICAAVSYNNARKNATYFFNWTNLDTDAQSTTERYSFSKKEDLKSGYVVSVYNKKTGEGVFVPGKYLVEFFYNNEQKLKTTFEIKPPSMQAIYFGLGDSLNEDYSPAGDNDNFGQIDTIYACVKFNYLITGNTIKAKWYDADNNLILESPKEIIKSSYSETFIPMDFQNDKGILPYGDYKVEVYLNDSLIETKSFKVLESEIKLGKFEDNKKYSNEEFSVSFIIPDNWKTVELTSTDGSSQVQLIPPSKNMEIGFLFKIQGKVEDNSVEMYDKISSNILEPFLKQIESEISYNETREGTSENDISYYEIIKGCTDSNGTEWGMPFCFLKNEGNLYILYGIINYTIYREDAGIIFDKIINSLEF